ncbi:MAG: hypothetical protein CVU98_01155 [Firmicutes bacterium HGW-Firmicutes-3]|nr:MAG: hypothetical protein CVU98_01155 [Firmicutes bacterium HGW-Firmicutes-3]
MNRESFKGEPRTKAGKKRKREITKRVLTRKEKALAEADALLVLGKKANAIWGLDNEEGYLTPKNVKWQSN